MSGAAPAGSQPYRVPARLNLAIAAAAIGASMGCLWAAAHAASWWLTAAAAFAFSFTGNTVFALLHEAVHGAFHPRRRVNEAEAFYSRRFSPPFFQSSASAISAITGATAPILSFTTTICRTSPGR